MITRRTMIASCLVASAGLSFPVFAAEQPFTPEAFAAAQKAGKHILIAVHASWCPVCKQQAPILERLSKDEKFKNLTFLRVDFDDQKPIVQSFAVQKQSTLIVYRGDRELGRSTGETKAEQIEQLIARGL